MTGTRKRGVRSERGGWMAVKCLRQEKMGEWGKHFYRSVKRISIAMEGCRRGNVRAEAEGEWRKESIIIEKPVVDYDRRFISFFPLISPLFFTCSSPASVSFGTRRTREGNEKGRKKYSGRMQQCSREHLPASTCKPCPLFEVITHCEKTS